MYWHPVFEKAYLDMLKAYGDFIKNSPYKKAILGIRMNYDAIGTEQTEVPSNMQDLSQWIVPGGTVQGVPYSTKQHDDYINMVTDTHLKVFGDDIRIFARTSSADYLDQNYKDYISNGRIGFFQTGSEMENRSVDGEYAEFMKYTRMGETVGYAEPMADAWGNHGSKKDARWCSPAQFNYWRLLSDLQIGISYIAIYGNDLQVAYDGKTPENTTDKICQKEFLSAFEFASRYAGYLNDPKNSPGAWIAFRASTTNKLTNRPITPPGSDYTFLMERQQDNSYGLTNQGLDEQRFGAWARVLPGKATMKLSLNDDFVSSLNGKETINVTYLDNSNGSFNITAGGKTFNVQMASTGRWQTAVFEADEISKDKSGAQIALTATNTEITLHMVEVSRRKS